jgi:hypothetical protein
MYTLAIYPKLFSKQLKKTEKAIIYFQSNNIKIYNVFKYYEH